MYLADKDVGVVSFSLSLSVVEYQTLVLRGDMDAANELLQDIPHDQMNKIARFLEGQGYKDLALDVATDPEHRFELALSLAKLNVALEIARQSDVDHKWKIVGDTALAGWDLALAEECFTHAKDLGSLLLLHTSSGNTKGLADLAQTAKLAGAHNVAFSAYWQLADVDSCIDLLIQTTRLGEAVLFSQTYKPSRTAEVALKWRDGLEKAGKTKVARIVGIPPGVEGADEDLFPEWDEYIKLENEGGKAADLIDVNGEEEGGGDAQEEEGEVNGTEE